MTSKLDVYDEEFAGYLIIAKNLIDEVTNEKDKEICKKWVAKLCSLKSTDVNIKRNRNSFFRYFLQVLQKGVASDGNDLDEKFEGMGDKDFMCRWSIDKRTYVAIKPLPGQGTLVYMAVSKDPSLGWDKDGVTTYL